MVIGSVDNKKIKELKKLKQKKYRDKNEMFLIEGIHLVSEAYKSGCLNEVLLLEGEIIDIDVKVTYVTKEILKNLTDLETPYNIIGICLYQETKEISGNVLALDGIQDPGNLGTIIRSALAFNIDTILISKDTVDVYNSKVLRASQGNNFHINIIRCDLLEELQKLRRNNYKIYGTNVEKGINLKNVEVNEKYAIIMGNEGAGVSKELSEISDNNIYINMNSECESLNVAVATSIILYELNK